MEQKVFSGSRFGFSESRDDGNGNLNAGFLEWTMRNIRIDLEYEGTRYHGWQVQPQDISIQQKLEEALARILGKKQRVIGAGRTDAGVHALGQTAHFFTENVLDSHSLHRALNSLLPDDIVVKAVKEVSFFFHARKSALKKRYEYWIWNKQLPSAFNHRFCWYVKAPLNVEKMHRAAQYLIGEHDFSSFKAAGCESGINPVRAIDMLEVKARNFFSEEYIQFAVEGRSFLRYMVRILVGTLVDVGRGKISEEDLLLILHARDRRKAGMTAPAKGLCLSWIQYPEGLDSISGFNTP